MSITTQPSGPAIASCGTFDGMTYLATALLTAIAAGAFGAAAPRASEEVGNVYVVHNLVSDQAGAADFQDTHLVNGWGLTRLPSSPWWVADNGTGLSTLYRGDGTPL